MKNVLKILSLIFVISMFLVACGDDDDKDPCEGVSCAANEVCENGDCVAECSSCGTYEGEVHSDGDTAKLIVSGSLGLNRPLEPTPFQAVITQNSSSSDSLDILATLDVEISEGNTVDVPVEVTVFFNATTNEFQAQRNREYVVKAAGLIDVTIKLVDFFGTVDGTEVSGEMVVDDPDGETEDKIDARFFFSGTK